MACIAHFTKRGLQFINVLFGILGIGMLGIGGYVFHVVADYETVSGDSFMSVPIFLLCLGAFTFLLSLAGCVGATKHSKCMTWTYIIVMILLVVLEISASIAGYVKKDDVSKVLVNIAEDSMNNWNNTVVQSTWDQVQSNFQCCGVESYNDWSNQTMTNNSFVNWAKNKGWAPDGAAPLNTKYPVPDSCCVDFEANCGLSYNFLDVENALLPPGSNKGCSDGLKDWVTSNIGIVAGIAAGFAVIEIFAIIFSLYLVCSDNGYETLDDEDYSSNRYRYA